MALGFLMLKAWSFFFLVVLLTLELGFPNVGRKHDISTCWVILLCSIVKWLAVGGVSLVWLLRHVCVYVYSKKFNFVLYFNQAIDWG